MNQPPSGVDQQSGQPPAPGPATPAPGTPGDVGVPAEEATRPAFAPPTGGNQSRSGTLQQPWQPAGGQPPAPQAPGHQYPGAWNPGVHHSGPQPGVQHTSRQPPVPPGPGTAPGPATAMAPAPGTRISPMGWALRGAALLGVSVVSGLLWLALTGGPSEQEAGPQEPVTQHDFKQVFFQEGEQKCANVSIGQIRDFFDEHRCLHLTRALYTTTLDDGQRVLTSVVTVKLPDPGLVRELDELVTQDDTGNIKDLASDDQAFDAPDGFPGLTQDVGFASQRQGRLLVVGESAYFGQPEDYEDERLGRITRDAMKQARSQDNS